MAPACVLSRAPQSFAIPLSDATSSFENVTEYIKPLQQLEAIARHLVASSYGGMQQIVGAAIVEEPLPAETAWWLVLTRSSGTKASNVKQWLRGRLPPDCRLDVDQLLTLTPMLQRRLGWGDVRTSPELLEALRRERALLDRGSDLVWERRELAAQELRLRESGPTPKGDHPVMVTSIGRLALRKNKGGDDSLLQQLVMTKATLALPAPPQDIALPLPPANVSKTWGTNTWYHVAQLSRLDDLLQLRATFTTARGAVYYHAPDLRQQKRQDALLQPRVLRFGLFSCAFDKRPEKAESSERAEPRCHTICVWGKAPFQVFPNANEDNAEELRHLARELGGHVTFPRLLMKVLYAIHGAVPPCPKLDPKLLAQMKTLWALRTGARPVDALKALDLDRMDFVLGRPAVTRCRVCYKPCDSLGGSQPVHRECQRNTFTCPVEGCGWTGELPPPPFCDDVEAHAQGLHKISAMLPRRCPECGFRGKTRRTDRPETRPASTKVSRK